MTLEGMVNLSRIIFRILFAYIMSVQNVDKLNPFFISTPQLFSELKGLFLD